MGDKLHRQPLEDRPVLTFGDEPLCEAASSQMVLQAKPEPACDYQSVGSMRERNIPSE